MRTMIILLLLLSASAFGTPRGIKPEDVVLECRTLGDSAYGVQLVRQDPEHPDIDQIIATFAGMLEETGEFNRASIIALSLRVREVARWVYAYYPIDWDAELVRSTYTGQCMEKTMAQLPEFANPEGGPDDQARHAWENQAIDI